MLALAGAKCEAYAEECILQNLKVKSFDQYLRDDDVHEFRYVHGRFLSWHEWQSCVHKGVARGSAEKLGKDPALGAPTEGSWLRPCVFMPAASLARMAMRDECITGRSGGMQACHSQILDQAIKRRYVRQNFFINLGQRRCLRVSAHERLV